MTAGLPVYTDAFVTAMGSVAGIRSNSIDHPRNAVYAARDSCGLDFEGQANNMELSQECISTLFQSMH